MWNWTKHFTTKIVYFMNSRLLHSSNVYSLIITCHNPIEGEHWNEIFKVRQKNSYYETCTLSKSQLFGKFD